MNQQNNHEANKQSESLTDLPLTIKQAEQTKAGGQLFRESLSGEGKKVTIDFCK